MTRFVAHGVFAEDHRLNGHEDLEEGGVVWLPRLTGPCVEEGETDYGTLSVVLQDLESSCMLRSRL